ncbi:hypothetical protein MYX78_03610 [Acidobacteria bacterium AH-259-G07]|nr:hypothetical protein [Acidobacteria bacterium AH-259-G07]
MDLKVRRAQRILGMLVTVGICGSPGCESWQSDTARIAYSESFYASAQTEGCRPTGRNFQPEDLAVLFPIRGWEGRTVVDLREDLVPLAWVMNERSYRNLIQVMVTYPGDQPDDFFEPSLNPFSSSMPPLGRINLDEWFITGLRLVPCLAPAWPVPTEWLYEEQIDGIPSRLVVCRPVIRLAAQRFGLVRDNELTSDDKSLHIIYNYIGHGVLSDAALEDIDRAEASAFNQIFGPDGTQRPSRHDVRQAIRAAYSPGVRSGLERLRRDFINLISRLRDASTSGALRIPYGGGQSSQALRNYRDFLGSGNINRVGDPKHITMNFNVSGGSIIFSAVWVLAVFDVRGGPGALVSKASFAQADLVFGMEDNGRVQRVSPGKQEIFANAAGLKTAIDTELRESIGQLSPQAAQQFLIKSALVRFGAVRDDNATVVSRRDVRGSQDLAEQIRVAYRTIHTPRHTAVGAVACVSCHLGSSFRLLGRVPGIQEAVRSSDNMNLSLFGPNTVEQVNLTQPWVLRILGYFGRTPCIGDRLAAEVQEDLRVLRELEAQQNR